ncbi:MAG: NAD-dependent epimerase/dehydratase family protein [Clostridia bacterium]|nr:NAD-dependent epimerase/dehydratase family protein [Clostridia bacterium]
MKKALLIAGGGTLGTHTANELLRLGHAVDIICPEEKVSNHPNLHFYQSYATVELLSELFAKEKYDAIVNFIHYKKPEDYKKIHPLLIQNTDHLIFLSSYRVYADEQHPVTEDAPRLCDIETEAEFRAQEDYALPKIACEDFLRNECKGQPWTIVRPVISFSSLRLDLYVHSGRVILEHAQAGDPLLIPAASKDLTAGLDWAGNSGKLIANLLFKPHTFGETYTVSSAQNLTWGQAAELYTELTGVKIHWCTMEEFLEKYPKFRGDYKWGLIYDRMFNRLIDNSKILAATGLSKEDFLPIRDGLIEELKHFK